MISIFMKQPISYNIHSNFLSAEECDNLLSSIPQPTPYNETTPLDRTELDIPEGLWYRLEYLPMRVEVPVTDAILDKLKKIMCKPFKIYDDRMYIIKYEEGDEATLHRDPCDDTLIIQLNDNFTGGTLYLDRYPIELDKGSAVLFTNNTCFHKVKTIQSGTRLTLAMWINYL